MLRALSRRLGMHLVAAVVASAAWLSTGLVALAQEAAEEGAAPAEAATAAGGGGLGTGAIIGIVVVLLVAVALIVVILKGRSGAKEVDKEFQPGPPDRPAKPLAETAREAAASRPPEPEPANEVPPGALALLEGIDGPLSGRRYELKIGHVVIGRDPNECMVHISETEDASISRKHAEIVWETGTWSVRCLTDKTFAVNGEPSSQGSSHALSSGDLITCGRSTFEFTSA